MTATLHRDNWEQYAAICEAKIEQLQAALKAIAEDHNLNGFIDRTIRIAEEALRTGIDEQKSMARMFQEERAQKQAVDIIDVLCELMAAHDAAWHRGATLGGAKAVREKAIAIMADALTPRPF